MSSNANSPDGPAQRDCFVTMKKIIALTEEFPFSSQQFIAYLNSLSDNDIVREFDTSKESMTEVGVFERTSTVEQRYLQTARILFNRLTDSQKSDLAPEPSMETIDEYRRILGSGEFVGSGKETLAMDIHTKKVAESYRKQVESPGVFCVKCDNQGKDAYFEKSSHYFKHMDLHRHVTLYGCHHCHLCLSSLENYYNHECNGTRRAVRKKYVAHRDFKISHSMIVCTDCGYTQNIHQSLSKATDNRQMDLLKTLYTNHNCKNLVLLKVMTTDSVQRATHDNWRAEFFLPLYTTFGDQQKLECCDKDFDDRGKFIQHRYEHLPQNMKMAAFIRSLHFQPSSYDKRMDCLVDQDSHREDSVSAADSVNGKFSRRNRELGKSLTFFSDDETQMDRSDDASALGDLRPGYSFSDDPSIVAVASNRVLTISFVSFHNRAEACPATGLDQTLVCRKCHTICLDDVSAGVHFSTCSNDKQVSKGLSYNAEAFSVLIFRNTLPIWPITCQERNCQIRCCSLEGYRTHMALSHGFIMNIVGQTQSTNKWPNCETPLSTTEAINEFCGLTREGLLKGILSKQCYQPGSGVTERRRRRARMFQQRDVQPMDETVAVATNRKEDAVVPFDERKEDEAMEVDEGPSENTHEAVSAREETAAQGQTFSSPLKRKRDPSVAGNTEAVDFNNTMSLFRPPPSEQPATVQPDFDDTMTVFQTPPPAPSANEAVNELMDAVNETLTLEAVNGTVTLDAQDDTVMLDAVDETLNLDGNEDESLEINEQPTDDETDPLTLQVTQMWKSSRISRESPITPEHVIDFGNRCFDCGFLLESAEALEEHMKHHESTFKCSLCDETRMFRRSRDLMQHLCDKHTKEGKDDDLMCEYCERLFSPEVLVPHLLYDCYSAPCGICGTHLQKLRHNERERHRKRHKDKYKRFRCCCKNNFANYLLFTQHICSGLKEVTFDLAAELFEGVVADDIADGCLYNYMKTIKVTPPAVTPPEAPPDTILVVDHTNGSSFARQSAGRDLVERPSTPPLPIIDILAAAQAAMDTPEKEPPSVMFVEPPSVLILDPPPAAPTLPDPPIPEQPPPSVMILDPPPPGPQLVSQQQPADTGVSAIDLLNENIVAEPEENTEEGLSRSVTEGYSEASTALAMDRTVSMEDTDDDEEIQFLEVVKTATKPDEDIVAVEQPSTSNTSISWNNEDGDMMVAEVPAGQRTTEKAGREKKFKCAMCSHAFFTSKSLQSHKQERHSTDISRYDTLYKEEYGLPINGFAHLCLHCNAAFEKPERFNYHFEAHVRIQSALFQCDHCSGIQLSSDNLGAHLDQHGMKANGSLAEPKIRWRCTECTPNVVFVDEGGYMLHLVQAHNLAMFYYCKACFLGSCTHTAMLEHMKANCDIRRGGIRGLGFVPANQINYQPAHEAEYAALVEQNPGIAVRLSSCTHRTFVRFGVKWTSCFEEKDCFGLINANRFEQHLRVVHNQFDEVELKAQFYPPTVYARPDYNIRIWLANSQITLTTKNDPWPWPFIQPQQNRRVPQNSATARRPRATPPTNIAPVPPPVMMNATTSAAYVPNGCAPPHMQQAGPPMQQIQPRYPPIQYMPAHMPGAPIPPQQIYQAPIPVPADLMSCAVCEQAGVMLKKFMIPLPRAPDEKNKYVKFIMRSVLGIINVQQTQEITKRMMQPEARLCWNHINPHKLTVQNGDLYLEAQDVCLDYPKFTETLMANPQIYKQKLENVIISGRSLSFNACNSIETLKADNICKNLGCVGRAALSTNAEIELHLAHYEQHRRLYCQLCSSFIKADELQMLQHIITCHYPRLRNVVYQLKCPICEQVFKEKADFLYHMRAGHSNLLNQYSKFCNTSVQHTSPYAKEYHDRMHNGILGNCCFICGLVNPPAIATRVGCFPQLPHEYVHAMKMIFTCRHCLQTYEQQCDFVDHFQRDHQAYVDRTGRNSCCGQPCTTAVLPQHLLQTHMFTRYSLHKPELAEHTLTVLVDQELYRFHLGLPRNPQFRN